MGSNVVAEYGAKRVNAEYLGDEGYVAYWNKCDYVGEWAIKSIKCYAVPESVTVNGDKDEAIPEPVNVNSVKCEAVPDPVNVNSVQQQPHQGDRLERTGPDPRILGEAPDTIMRCIK